jgi:alpha-tubulin suppressor-like RCC1 family protein
MCVLLTTGGVRCWGGNDFGQLGNGTTTGIFSPPTSDVLTGVQSVAAGRFFTCALMTTGGVRCWGNNDFGQLGDSGAVYCAVPVQVLGTCQ